MLNQRSNIPAAPAYKVYISQFIRYFKAGGSYQNFLDSELLLTRKLLYQKSNEIPYIDEGQLSQHPIKKRQTTIDKTYK
jgi:hypothetical protein